MQLIGANPTPQIAGVEELPGKVNYFLGKDRERWRTNIPTFAKVKYLDVYPGVDLAYYGNQRQLEYDLVVAPGADPQAIKLTFQDRAGQDIPLQITANGDLVLYPTEGEVHLRKPQMYQEIDGVKQPIAGRYVLLGSKVANSEQKTVGFEVATYDVSKPLIIDPVLSYSTYLGGSSGEGIQNDFDNGGIAVDIAGDAYVVGFTGSSDFPLSSSPPQNFHGGTFVTKFDATGSVIVYSAFLDNTDAGFGRGIAVDTAGNAYVIGHTHSADFPTVNPFQPSYGGDGDAFVAKLNETGSALIYSTYLGGLSEDSGNAIAVDAAGNAYVTGYTTSPDFPVVNPIQASRGGDRDAFVAKLNAAGSALDYSTYLGGSVDVFSHNTAWDEGRGVAVDSSGNAYVAGITYSTNFPTVNPLQPAIHGNSSDAFVTKLNSTGSAFIYSTYLGGNEECFFCSNLQGDEGYAIAIDAEGSAYVTGVTNPTDRGIGAFAAKLNTTGSALIYFTYLGPGRGFGAAVDTAGNAYVTGHTGSPDFPVVNPIQASYGGGVLDAFVAKLNGTGTILDYSTYLGGNGRDSGTGIAVDAVGNAYVTGWTDSLDFPTVNPLQIANAGSRDAFVAKISEEAALSLPRFPVVFVHGTCSDSETWKPATTSHLTSLGWKFGGTLGQQLVDSAFDDLASHLPADADFYLVNFFDPIIRAGLTAWGNELNLHLDRINSFRMSRGLPRTKFIVVAHSAGGLAARSYLQSSLYRGDIYHLVTYGTPHRGTPSARWELMFVGVCDRANIPDVEFIQGIKEMDPDSGQPFLHALNDKLFPDFVLHTSLIGSSPECLLLLPERNDCVVPVTSQNIQNIHSPPNPSTVETRETGARHTKQTSDFTNILWAIGRNVIHGIDRIAINLASPVDIIVTDPLGRSISKDANTIPFALYEEIEDDSGELHDAVTIPLAVKGKYQILVVPEPGALPTDTFSLTVQRNDTTLLLADHVQIQAIPAEPYTVRTPDAGDFDGDGDIDQNDLDILVSLGDGPSSGPEDTRDLNNDGVIDALDARQLATLCSRPDCSTNTPPIANAGPDQTVAVGSLVTLNGSGSSDPDNGPGPLSFTWTQTAGPTVTLAGADTATPTFTPTAAGSYTFSLTVNDGQVNSDPDTVIITVDGCPDDPNKTEPGICGCGVPDTDSDGDGVANCRDNCPTITNPDQKDSNGDGKGDACTEVCGNCRDDDGDGLVDLRDPDCPSSGLTIEKGVLALKPDPQEDKITLQGTFAGATDSINPPAEGVTISLIDTDGLITCLNIPPGAGWKTSKGPQWVFKDKKDGSSGDPEADEKVRIEFNPQAGGFKVRVKVKEAELSDPDAGDISTSIMIGGDGFLNTQAWQPKAKGKKLVTP